MIKFSIVVPASRPGTVHATIESIVCQSYSNWELVVIGQAEDAQLREVVERYSHKDKRVRYHHIEQNGASRARNAGVQSTDGDILAFTDDDCVADVDWLKVMEQIFRARPDIGLVGGALIPPLNPGARIAYCFSWIPEETVFDPVASASSPKGWGWTFSSVGFRRSIYRMAGMFDEYLGPGSRFYAAEDLDYAIRLETLGVKMAATPRAAVYHTYGYRYGIRGLMKQSRNYTCAKFGLAGKLTLMRNPRGRKWMEDVWKQSLTNWILHFRPYRLPYDLYKLWNATSAYRLCIKQYKVQSGLLTPISS